MPQFKYVARTADGKKKTKGVMIASSKIDLANKIESQGDFLIWCEEKNSEENSRAFMDNLSRIFQKKVPKKHVADFLKQLKVYIRAGIAIPAALEETQKTTGNKKFQEIIQSVKATIENGETLAEALATFPGVFDTMLVESIRMGEESGSLPEVIQGQSDRLAREAKLVSKMKSQSVYPVLLCTIVFTLLIVMNTIIVPNLMNSYESFLPKGDVPPKTALIMGINQWLMDYGWLLPSFMVVFFFSFVFAELHPATKKLKDAFKLKIPIIKTFILYSNLSRVCDGIKVGYSSGMPITKILQFLEKHVNNMVVQERVRGIYTEIINGTTFSLAVKQNHLDHVFSSLASAGEGTGNLTYTMDIGMDHYNEKLDSLIGVATTVGSFMVVIFLGLIVMFTVMSIIIPMYELPSALI
ncbi:type II secretion system F family protein [Geoalkalibacter subterraneus]|uniref:Type II secretion system protein GspF domain-containing protein n=1 Tax=Geoalkalibacter subterraneus TaxID=483547 RepID=A0A0B5FIU4_9BACT|nr:type II secretion system F family protein [Geoalkalibacter subterraneus]AJF08117.1 hypothetical protein GSUB_16535 [Geoalkalibacter subterraneus]